MDPTLELRIDNLENLVNYLISIINSSQYYIGTDIDACRYDISKISPTYTETKTAYIDDTFVTFENIPSGNISVLLSDPTINYTVVRDTDIVTVYFQQSIKEVMEITLSIT